MSTTAIPRADRWPSRTALDGPDGNYTYAELTQAAAELAREQQLVVPEGYVAWMVWSD